MNFLEFYRFSCKEEKTSIYGDFKKQINYINNH